MTTTGTTVRPPTTHSMTSAPRRRPSTLGAAAVVAGIAVGIAVGIVLVAALPVLRFDGWQEACLAALTVSAWVCALSVHIDAIGRRDLASCLRSLGALGPWAWSAYALLQGRSDPHLTAAAVAAMLVVLCDLVQREAGAQGEDAAGWYIALALGAAGLAGGAWWAAEDLGAGAAAGLATLLVAAPVAPALADATTRLVLRRRGAVVGCVVVGDAALRTVAQVETFVLDKDGTVTTGALRVASVEPVEPDHDRNLRWFAGALEHASEHPIGQAIAKLASAGSLTNVQHHPGRGLSGSVDRHPVRVGDPEWLGIASTPGIGTTVGVEVDGRTLGRITVWDDVRDGARAGLAALHDLGVQTVLVSDGTEEETRHLAELIRPTTTHAGLDGTARAELVESLRRDGRRVAYAGPVADDQAAGDPARQAADIAVGTDATAGVVVVDPDVARLPRIVRLCRSVARRSLLSRRVAVVGTLAGMALAVIGALPPPAAALVAVVVCAATAGIAAST